MNVFLLLILYNILFVGAPSSQTFFGVFSPLTPIFLLAKIFSTPLRDLSFYFSREFSNVFHFCLFSSGFSYLRNILFNFFFSNVNKKLMDRKKKKIKIQKKKCQFNLKQTIKFSYVIYMHLILRICLFLHLTSSIPSRTN